MTPRPMEAQRVEGPLLIDTAPLLQALDLIENGAGFQALREHLAAMSPERRAQIEGVSDVG